MTADYASKDMPTNPGTWSPEHRAWDQAVGYTNGVAQDWLAGRVPDSRLEAAFARERALFAAWGGPKG